MRGRENTRLDARGECVGVWGRSIGSVMEEAKRKNNHREGEKEGDILWKGNGCSQGERALRWGEIGNLLSHQFYACVCVCVSACGYGRCIHVSVVKVPSGRIPETKLLQYNSFRRLRARSRGKGNWKQEIENLLRVRKAVE